MTNPTMTSVMKNLRKNREKNQGAFWAKKTLNRQLSSEWRLWWAEGSKINSKTKPLCTWPRSFSNSVYFEQFTSNCFFLYFRNALCLSFGFLLASLKIQNKIFDKEQQPQWWLFVCLWKKIYLQKTVPNASISANFPATIFFYIFKLFNDVF